MAAFYVFIMCHRNEQPGVNTMLRTIATCTLGTIATIACLTLCTAPIVGLFSINAAMIALWTSLTCGLCAIIGMQWLER